MINRINRQIRKINDAIDELLKISLELSHKLGTDIRIENIREDELSYDVTSIIVLPRPCGCCYLELNEKLYPSTKNLKEIVAKMRIIEDLIVKQDPDNYSIMYTISLPVNVRELMNLSEEKIVEMFFTENEDC